MYFNDYLLCEQQYAMLKVLLVWVVACSCRPTTMSDGDAYICIIAA